MEFINPDVQQDYERWTKQVTANDQSYDRFNTLDAQEVLKAHYLIADFFREEGATMVIGPKSLDLLHSALSRAHVSIGNVYKWNTKYEIAATTLYGLIKNHPFHDANKRTAFLCILHLLKKNELIPTVTDIEFENFLVEIAETKADNKLEGLKKRNRYQQLLQDKEGDPEIRYISWWLRNHTRQIEGKDHTITYRDLKRILNKNDFDIQNPRKNYIDLMQFKKKSFLKKEHYQKIRTINFPGMAKQVPKGELKKIREATKMTEQNGFDSKVFFDGEENFNILIAKYEQPLRRLADR